MTLTEAFTLSKTGNNANNEDGFFFNEYFAAVIDGTTSKTADRFEGMTGGRFAMLTLKSALNTVAPDLPPQSLLEELNRCLKISSDRFNGEVFPSASLVIYNDYRKELISYGDCKYIINGTPFTTEKQNDTAAAQKRAKIIKDLLAEGASILDIQKDDPGRKAITDELKKVLINCANKEVDGGFPVMNGTQIVRSFIRVHKIPQNSDLILASDGYREVLPTLEKSENRLLDMLKQDVLCIEQLLSTKGVSYGNVSFDDRTYLRFST